MIIVYKICMVVVGLVGVAAVDLRSVVSGVNLGHRRLHWQGVDSVRGWGVAAAW